MTTPTLAEMTDAGRAAFLDELMGGIASFLPDGTAFTLVIHGERVRYLSTAQPSAAVSVMRECADAIEAKASKRPALGRMRR